MPHRNRKRPGTKAVVGTVLLLAVVATCFRLGLWQLDRLAQRRALNERVAARQAVPPVTDERALADTATSLYRRVLLAGRFDNARSVVIPGRALRGVPGVHLLTPFLVAPEAAVMVNRGWLPSADGATIAWDSVPPAAGGAGSASITGLVLPFVTDDRGRRAATSDGGFRRVWYRLDLDALRGQYPYRLLPVIVQLLPQPGVTQRPERLAAPALDNGPHLSYAVQWFGFATIGVLGWLALAWRARHPPGEARPPEAVRESLPRSHSS